eukprot:Hpha_TRINITY_DN16680_c2_g7::TRINITY_DN16680_c2_g7_i2::g.182381::m.182381
MPALEAQARLTPHTENHSTKEKRKTSFAVGKEANAAARKPGRERFSPAVVGLDKRVSWGTAAIGSDPASSIGTPASCALASVFRSPTAPSQGGPRGTPVVVSPANIFPGGANFTGDIHDESEANERNFTGDIHDESEAKAAGPACSEDSLVLMPRKVVTGGGGALLASPLHSEGEKCSFVMPTGRKPRSAAPGTATPPASTLSTPVLGPVRQAAENEVR